MMKRFSRSGDLLALVAGVCIGAVISVGLAEARPPTTVIGTDFSSVGQTSTPVSAVSGWRTANTAINVADAATVTNPETQVTRATTPIIKGAGGTTLRVRMAYDASLVVTQAPVVKVFGRTGSDAWQLLKSSAGNIRETISVASTDVTNGTLDFTTPDQFVQSWDRDGCEEILIVVETALAGTGTVSTAYLQVKFI